MSTTIRTDDRPAPTTTGTADDALAGLLGRDALYVVLTAVQLLAAALVTPFITRMMSRSQFGLLASANALMQVLFVIASAGLATALQREHARGDALRARRVLTTCIGAAVLVGVIAEVTSPWWIQSLGMADDATMVRLSVVWATSSAVTGASLALVRSRDQLARFALVSLLQSVVAEVVSLALVASHSSQGARWFVLGQLIAQLAAMVLGLGVAPPAALRRRDADLVRAALRFSLPLVPMALSAFVLASADRLVLQGLVGSEAVGGYQLAYNMASVPVLLIGLLSTSWLPRLFALDGARASVLAASRDVIYRLLPPVIIGMAVGGPVVLHLWAPASYQPGALLLTFVIVVVGVLPSAGAGAATRTLVLAGRTGTSAVANCVAAGVNVALNLVLDPRLGAAGAAVATLASMVLLWLLTSLAAHRVLPQPPPDASLTLLLGVAVAGALGSTQAAQQGAAALAARLLLSAVALAWLAATARAVRRSARGTSTAAA